MSNEGKKSLWISTAAHLKLKEYCDRTGRTQVDVVTELVYRFVKPELEKAK